jgi:hypothetical protein
LNSHEQVKSDAIQNTYFLKKSGILDAYESIYCQMILESWPKNKSIFEHSADLLLKY